jgi:tripartite-type tricarboxylate transporter receptor subunit TctC
VVRNGRPTKNTRRYCFEASHAIAETLRLPDVARRLADFSAIPVGATPNETATFIKVESDRWRHLIDATGFKIN